MAQDVIDNPNRNQTYLSYAELPTKGFAATDTDAKYFKETTTGRKALESENPAAAMPSVILVGQYSISVNGGVAAPADFYTYLSGPVDGQTEDRPYVYFGNNAQGNSTVAGGESMLKRFLAQTTILFKQNADGTTYSRYSIANGADLTKLVGALAVSEISDNVKQLVGDDGTGKLKLQANVRSLQFKNADVAEGIYIATGNGYMQIVADNYGEAEGETFNTNTMVRLSRMVSQRQRAEGCSKNRLEQGSRRRLRYGPQPQLHCEREQYHRSCIRYLRR